MAYDLYIDFLHKQLSYAMAHGLVPPENIYRIWYSLYMDLYRYDIAYKKNFEILKAKILGQVSNLQSI